MRAQVLLTLLMIAVASRASARPPQAPVEITISPTASFTAGASATVRLTVTLATATAASIRVRAFVKSVTGAPVRNGLVADEVVKVDKTAVRPIEVPVDAAGEFRVNVIAEEVKGGVSDGATVYVRLDEEGALEMLTPHRFSARRARVDAGGGARSTKPVILGSGVLEEAPSRARRSGRAAARPSTRSSMARAAARGPASADTALDTVDGIAPVLELVGTISTNINGIKVPMSNVTVEAWDSDTVSPDDLLATMTTDQYGNYNVTFTNDDGPLGNGVDVYLYITSKYANINMIMIVQDVIAGGGLESFNYTWRSPTQDDLIGPTVVMNFQITEYEHAAAVWMGASRARYLVAQLTSKSIAYVEIRYPGTSTGVVYNPTANVINIDPNMADAPEVVGHEYAHAVMDQAYGANPGEGGAHVLCSTASPGLAWSEGFATAFGLVVGHWGSDWGGGGIFHFFVGDTGESFEWYSCTLRSITIDEGRVAAALWDLYDASNDSSSDPDLGVAGFGDYNRAETLVSIQTLLAPLWSGPQADVTAYWPSLKATLTPAQTATSNSIMAYNYYSNP
jgi:hypothetical protein